MRICEVEVGLRELCLERRGGAAWGGERGGKERSPLTTAGSGKTEDEDGQRIGSAR